LNIFFNLVINPIPAGVLENHDTLRGGGGVKSFVQI